MYLEVVEIMPLNRKNIVVFNIMVLLILFNISNASILNTRYLPFLLSIILFGYLAFKRQIVFGRKFLFLVIGWISVNMLAILTLHVNFFLSRLIINTVNLLFLPYMLLYILGGQFWEILEKWIYRLTVISIPLWLLSNLIPQTFIDLSQYFEQITAPTFLANTNYYSTLIFTHAQMDNNYGIYRNCGFMWEPGAFSLMIIWSIIYNWLRDKEMLFSSRIWVYTIAILTTFSTAGYFALIFLLAGFLFKKFKIFNFILLIGSLFFFFAVVYELEFISGKIEDYYEEFVEDPTGESGYTGHKVNRLQGGIAAVIRTKENPFGYGLVSVADTGDKWYAYGTNGLGSLLEMWGVFLFPVLIVSIFRSLKVINGGKRNKISVTLFFSALMIVFFSNPIHRSLIVYFLVITPIVFTTPSTKKLHILNSSSSRYKIG